MARPPHPDGHRTFPRLRGFRSPWFQMWVQPRRTIRALIESSSPRGVWLLAASGGIAQALSRAYLRHAGRLLSLWGVLAFCVIVGALIGVAYLGLAGFLFRWSGSWLGGRASAREVRTAVAWSGVPRIWTLLIWIPLLAYFGEDLFIAPGAPEALRLSGDPWLVAAWAADLLIGLWSFVIFLKAFAEVQRFSAWRALAAVVLAALAVGTPVLGTIGITRLLPHP